MAPEVDTRTIGATVTAPDAPCMNRNGTARPPSSSGPGAVTGFVEIVMDRLERTATFGKACLMARVEVDAGGSPTDLISEPHRFPSLHRSRALLALAVNSGDDVRSAPWNSTRRCTRRAPCAGSRRTRSPSTSRPASSMRPSGPPRAATSRTGASSCSTTRPRRPPSPPFTSTPWASCGSRSTRPSSMRPTPTPRPPSPSRSSRSSARPSGWPTTSRTCPSTSSPSASTTRRAAPSTPPSGTPCWPPGRGRGQLHHRAFSTSTRPRRSRSSASPPTRAGSSRAP